MLSLGVESTESDLYYVLHIRVLLLIIFLSHHKENEFNPIIGSKEAAALGFY